MNFLTKNAFNERSRERPVEQLKTNTKYWFYPCFLHQLSVGQWDAASGWFSCFKIMDFGFSSNIKDLFNRSRRESNAIKVVFVWHSLSCEKKSISELRRRPQSWDSRGRRASPMRCSRVMASSGAGGRASSRHEWISIETVCKQIFPPNWGKTIVSWKNIHPCLEVGTAIRTGVRLGSITKETALNSKL